MQEKSETLFRCFGDLKKEPIYILDDFLFFIYRQNRAYTSDMSRYVKEDWGQIT